MMSVVAEHIEAEVSMPVKRILALVVVLAAVGCQTAAPPPKPLAKLPDAIRWVKTSAEYRASVVQVYRLAGARLEEVARGRAPRSWAVILDADETVISNLQFEVELARSGEPYSDEGWGAWVRRQDAPPLPGAVAFMKRVRELGGVIAIVTNRAEQECPDTQADFKKYGIPYDVVLCRPVGVSSKEPRFQRVASGTASPDIPPVEVLMWLGDNIIDFPGGSQELRKAPLSSLDGFGVRYFVLPNPMYGSWQRNPED
jgi:5'-nucleotidase (lipoprotein e(P4) family)